MLMLGLAPLTRAADKAGDVTGNWHWTQQGRGQNTQPMTVTMKLKQDGDKVTGTVSGMNNSETEIKDGMIKDGTISFTVTRTFNDQSFTTKYNGKIEGDSIKGKTTSERNGQTRERDWEAKRGDAPATQPAQ